MSVCFLISDYFLLPVYMPCLEKNAGFPEVSKEFLAKHSLFLKVVGANVHVANHQPYDKNVGGPQRKVFR